jgi:hypothetical protein
LGFCVFPRTENDAAVDRKIWDVYPAYRRGKLISVPLPVPATIEQIADEMMKRMGGVINGSVRDGKTVSASAAVFPQSGRLPAGWLAFTGRESNPLDRFERFQITFSFTFPGLLLALPR